MRRLRAILTNLQRSLGGLLSSEIQIAFNYSESNLRRMLVIMAALFPLFYVFELAYDPSYNTLWLRLVFGSLSCLAYLAIAPQLERKGRAFLLFGLSLVCIPWLFAMFMFLNAATTSELNSLHFAYPASYLAAICIFSILYQSFVLVLGGTVVGFGVGLATIPLFVDSANWNEISETVTTVGPFALVTIVIAALVNRNKEHVSLEFADQGKLIGEKVATTLFNPLQAIYSRVSSQQIAYESFVSEHSAELTSYSPRQIDLLRASFHDIGGEVGKARSIAETFLLHADPGGKEAEASYEHFSIVELLSEIIETYPFASEDQASRIVRGSNFDFQIKGPRLHIKHVVVNLIKNALYYVEDGGDPESKVEISCLPGETDFEAGRVVVLDTGPGIPIENQSRVFDRFFSTTPSGSGIGLGFVKKTMESIGGSVELNSLIDKYTRFTLVFGNE